MASYTYSKFLDDTGGAEEWASISSGFGGTGTIRNYYDLKADYGVDSTDVPQSLALNYVYELPVGKGKKFGSGMNAIADGVAGGWQVSGITHVQAGFPLGIGANNNGGSLWGGSQHANLTGAGFKTGGCGGADSKHPFIPVGTKYCLFNGQPGDNSLGNGQGPFAQAPAYTFGNTKRFFSNLRAPGYVDEDLGIQKMFNLSEKFHLQFTAQMFNAFNHTNFDAPDTNLSDAGTIMGEPNNTQGPRQVQLSLKLTR
jgi:hypothetical protein